MTTHYDVLIIGASSAGIAAADAARKAAPEIRIACITEEAHLPYYRPLLTEYLADPTVTDRATFTLRKEEWFTNQRIELLRETPVSAMDTAAKSVTSASGQSFSYGSLVLATGSNPFVPLREAQGLPGVFTLRSLDDAARITAAAETARDVVIIGGGLLGLEAAWSLRRGGRKVTVVEMIPRILPKQLDEATGGWFARRIEAAGVSLRTGTQVKSIAPAGGRLSLDLGDETLETDLVLFSIGVRARTDLARESGIAVERGIVVDEHMETSVPGVFACGDAAQFGQGQVPLWMPAMRMGQVAGHNATGAQPKSWTPSTAPAALSAFDTRLFSVGELAGTLVETIADEDHGIRCYFDGDILAGALLWGDTAKGLSLVKAMETHAPRAEVEALL